MTTTTDAGALTALGALLGAPKAQVRHEALLAALAAGWGITGDLRLTPLSSERDLNFRLETGKGGASYLVRVTHPAETEAMTRFQSRAHLHLAQADPDLPIPHLVAPRAARAFDAGVGLWAEVEALRVRLFTWLSGQPMAETAGGVAQALTAGTMVARLARGLAGFEDPAARYNLLWDISQCEGLLALLPQIGDAELSACVTAAVEDYRQRIAPQLAALPWQVCHNDANPSNVMVDRDDPMRVTGIIDFGDMIYAPRACELAVACAYHIDVARGLHAAQAFIAGFHAVHPLSAAEYALLPALVRLRLLTTRTIAAWRAARYPENADYILRNAGRAREALAVLEANAPEALLADLKGVVR